ncbi:metallophosphoesterase [Paenibacillus sp. F411]|uniref:metallophosphoesterase n=1 Tax=Paenibacillus sp. F411 TaxID=2820239 RepID=UPI001FBA25F2|nr:metallophosphoesterase [Paenibacillus sp. F411]
MNTSGSRSGTEPDSSPSLSPPLGRGMTRRQFLKRGFQAAAAAGLLGAGYGAFWEPNHIELTRLNLQQQRLPASFHGMKIVHFSDLHLGFPLWSDKTGKVVEMILQEKPDLIVFTGDMVDGRAQALDGSLEALSRLQAPLGVLSILGNHDYENADDLVSKQASAGFTVLRNSHVLLERRGKVIAVAGLEDWLEGTPDAEQALQGIPEGMYTLMLMHEPDYAGIVSTYPVDLQLSGHSHGGQIRLPGIGEVVTPPGALRYVQGLYNVGERGMPLYVNRGLGTTRLPMRFLCRPEITVLTLSSR